MVDLWIIVNGYNEKYIWMLTSRRSTRTKKKRERRERKWEYEGKGWRSFGLQRPEFYTGTRHGKIGTAMETDTDTPTCRCITCICKGDNNILITNQYFSYVTPFEFIGAAHRINSPSVWFYASVSCPVSIIWFKESGTPNCPVFHWHSKLSMPVLRWSSSTREWGIILVTIPYS